jgi:hypothetical protein
LAPGDARAKVIDVAITAAKSLVSSSGDPGASGGRVELTAAAASSYSVIAIGVISEGRSAATPQIVLSCRNCAPSRRPRRFADRVGGTISAAGTEAQARTTAW